MPLPALIPIVGKVLLGAAADQLASTVIQRAVGSPSGSVEGKDYKMRISVKNATQFDMRLAPTPVFWSSGRYADGQGAQSVGPFDQLIFEVCNSDNSGGGVTGGNAFQLVLDHNTTFNFAIGWTCPVWGSYKAYILESSSAEEGYNNASSSGNSAVSNFVYKGKNAQGQEIGVRFRIEATPGQCPVFKIIQETVGADLWQ